MSSRPYTEPSPAGYRGSGAAAPTALLAGLLFFPAALPFLVGASSFLIGTVLICLALLAIYAAGFVNLHDPTAFTQISVFTALLIFLLIAHLAICYFFIPVALGRAILTLPILVVFLFSVPIVISILFERDDASVDRAVLIVMAGYVLSALLSVVGLQPPGNYGEKPTFPFTEPSFLAFTIAPVLIYFCVTKPVLWRWIAIAFLAVFAVTVSNLTTVAMCLLAILTFARWWQIGGAVTAGYLVWPYVDQDYFLDRLTLSVDTVNLTALVYIQGWQLLDEAMRVTKGWGRGFQQLGIGYTNTIASYRINQIQGGDVNLLDGGFLLAKVGSEFGVLGLLAIAVLTIVAGFALVRLRAVALGKAAYSRPLVLAYSSVVGSIVEIYLRGSTYFTGTMLLLCSSLFFIANARKIRTSADDLSVIATS